MADVVTDSARSIRRRSLAYWAAVAVLLIFVTSAGALCVATYLADLV